MPGSPGPPRSFQATMASSATFRIVSALAVVCQSSDRLHSTSAGVLPARARWGWRWSYSCSQRRNLAAASSPGVRNVVRR